MKPKWIILAVILFIPASSAEINVVVSLPDFEPIVREIGGNEVRISVILPSGTDPHAFSITRETIDKVKNADLIILANSALLSYEKDIKENYDKNYLDFENYEKNGAELIDFGDYKKNPHGYWLYVNNSIAIARTIAYKLAEIEPEKADYFISSFNDFESRLLEAEKIVIKKAKENGIHGKKVVAAVPGVCYIAKNVGMEADKILFSEGAGMISMEEMEEIKNGLKSKEYAAIIVPEIFKNAKVGNVARQIAMDSNSSVIYVKFAEGGESYINLFYYNAIAIISTGNQGVSQEKYNLWLVYLSISLALLAAFEAFLLYKYREIK